LKIKPSEIKGWLESVQDEEDLENSTVDKIRRVMHLVYSMAQANDLIPRSVEANPVKHVRIATTTGYEAVLGRRGKPGISSAACKHSSGC
jgi:hypothetical protein